jgi:hypothetical protein
MNYLSLLIAFLTLNIAMAASPFVGSWNLVEIYSENMTPETLPPGSYHFKIQEQDPEHLQLNIKVGNNLGSSITLLEGSDNNASFQKVRIGGVRSTMMMPPENQFKLETYLSNMLPKITSITIVDDTTLILEGEGKIVCQQLN